MPRLFVIHTATHQAHITAMDFEDAVLTWGGAPEDIDWVEEYENPQLGVDTIH
jgi:hypothetical protein